MGKAADQIIEEFELPDSALDYFLTTVTHKTKPPAYFNSA
jgi:hypothetical protein